MGIEELNHQKPETLKDGAQERSVENFHTPELLQKIAEAYIEKVQKSGDQITAEGTSLAKTPEEEKIADATKEEVKKVVSQAENAGSGLKEWQDMRDQELQDGLKSIDVHNPVQVAKWFEEHTDELVEERNAFIMGYVIEDLMRDLLFALEKAHTVELGKDFWLQQDPISHYETQRLDDYGEGTLSGDISIFGRDVCRYGAYNDGYGGSIDEWNTQELEESMKEFLEKLQDAKK